MSLPSRERGLKFSVIASIVLFILSLPSRERGLKYDLRHYAASIYHGRSPRGSVD